MFESVSPDRGPGGLARLRERVRGMSARAELVVVLSISFSYFVATSLAVFLLRIRSFDLTTGRVARGLVVELVILAIVWWILTVRDWKVGEVVGRFSWRSVLAGVPLAIGYYVFYVAVVLATIIFLGPFAQQFGVQMTPLAPFALMVLFIVLNSLFEETLVTGYAVSALRPKGAAIAICGSAFLRTLYHLYHGPAAMLAILPLGLAFAGVYWRWRKLWPLYMAHTLANLFAFATAAG